MELIVAFKQTDIGPLPNDWDVVPLGELVSQVEYGSSAKSRPKGRVPVLRMGNIQHGKIDWSDLVYTDDEDEIERYALHDGEVLFNRTNTIDLVGKTSIYEGRREAIFAGYLIRVVTQPGMLDARYLNYIMNTEVARKYSAKVLSVAVGQANINGQKLRTYPIPLPPTVAEQQAIAEALGDVDKLLERLNQLISKKRDLRIAVMQQLLSGRTRLPGFAYDWQKSRIGDIGKCLRGVTYRGDSDLLPGDTPRTCRLLRANNIQSGVIIVQDLQFVKSARVSPHQLMQQDDILICMANGSRALVGKAGLFSIRDEFEYTFGAFMGCLRVNFNLADPRFVFYLFSTAKYRNYIHLLLAGSTINNLRPSSIESLEFDFPSISEQRAIADVLTDLDCELASLQKRRNKTADLKLAVMQELLTGKTRLITSGSANG